MRVLAAVVLAALVLVGVPAPGQADETDPTTWTCTSDDPDVTMLTIDITSAGEAVRGCFAHPATGASAVTDLVVMTHGFGHSVQGSWLPHMEHVVAETGAAALAMNYRDNYGFPIMRGAEDTLIATELVVADLPELETLTLFSVSMGSAIGGTALHLAPSYGVTFTNWIDVEGATSPIETYLEAKAAGLGVEFARIAAEGMERDAGGTLVDVPQAYVDRSPILHVDAMKAAGLASAVVIHPLNDGLVPYDQGRQMSLALGQAGIDTEMITVLRSDADHTKGTTPTAHAGQPDFDPNEQYVHLSGHASEADGEHFVMRLALARLVGVINGQGVAPGSHEFIEDAQIPTWS